MAALNLTCPINNLSYGIVSRNILKHLALKGVEVALFPIGQIEAPPSEHQVIREAIERAKFYDKKANSLRIYHQFDLAQHVGVGHHVGFPIFELNKFKRHEIHQLRQQDALITCSGWGQYVLHEQLDAGNNWNIPLGVDAEIFHPDVTPMTSVSFPDNTTVFLNVGKWEVRKGHVELIQAFNDAFEKIDDVKLILHCKNPFYSEKEESEYTRYAQQSKLSDKIVIIYERLSTQQEVAQLVAAADCGVFPSKAEGWNMPLSEMMAMGKHVIATDYSAHREFCNHDNAMLIECDGLEPADDGKWFLSGDPTWHGQPGEWLKWGSHQRDQLVSHMREIHYRKQGKLGVNQAGIDTMKRFTWERTADAIIQDFV